MSDQPEAVTLDLEEMQSYLLVAIDKDGEYVVAASQNLSLPEMGMLLGRAQTDLNIQVAGMGAYEAMQKVMAQRTIMQPSHGLTTPGN